MIKWYMESHQHSSENFMKGMSEPDDYRNHMQMNSAAFEVLLKMVSPLTVWLLKSAFDVDNGDIILGQFVVLGIKGELFKWIIGCRSNQRSRVLYEKPCRTTKGFDLGKPQGGVLSQFLLSVLTCSLLSQLTDVYDTTVTYAEHLCMHFSSICT